MNTNKICLAFTTAQLQLPVSERIDRYILEPPFSILMKEYTGLIQT